MQNGYWFLTVFNLSYLNSYLACVGTFVSFHLIAINFWLKRCRTSISNNIICGRNSVMEQIKLSACCDLLFTTDMSVDVSCRLCSGIYLFILLKSVYKCIVNGILPADYVIKLQQFRIQFSGFSELLLLDSSRWMFVFDRFYLDVWHLFRKCVEVNEYMLTVSSNCDLHFVVDVETWLL